MFLFVPVFSYLKNATACLTQNVIIFVNTNYHKLKIIILPTAPESICLYYVCIEKNPLANSQPLFYCQHTIMCWETLLYEIEWII